MEKCGHDYFIPTNKDLIAVPKVSKQKNKNFGNLLKYAANNPLPSCVEVAL